MISRSSFSLVRGTGIPLKKLSAERQKLLMNFRRMKRTSASKKNLSNALKKQAPESNEVVFGLKPVDFTIVPPIRFSPPAPPPKPGLQKYLFPASILVTLGITAYFYFNNENDSKDYWETMQTGGALPGTYDDDDDDDDVYYEDDE